MKALYTENHQILMQEMKEDTKKGKDILFMDR